MNRDSVIFALSGTFFGLLVGWILGSQTSGPSAPAAAPVAQSAPAAPATQQTPPFDAERAAALEQQIAASPGDATLRTELGNVYFDAARYQDAIGAYEASLQINPGDVNTSTDLAVSYYSVGRVDDALAQIERSLAIEPTHAKTLFNQGVIRAFGAGDMAGARESWERVVAVAPTSEEARRAQQGLTGLQTAFGAEVPGAGADGGE